MKAVNFIIYLLCFSSLIVEFAINIAHYIHHFEQAFEDDHLVIVLAAVFYVTLWLSGMFSKSNLAMFFVSTLMIGAKMYLDHFEIQITRYTENHPKLASQLHDYLGHLHSREMSIALGIIIFTGNVVLMMQKDVGSTTSLHELKTKEEAEVNKVQPETEEPRKRYVTPSKRRQISEDN